MLLELGSLRPHRNKLKLHFLHHYISVSSLHMPTILVQGPHLEYKNFKPCLVWSSCVNYQKKRNSLTSGSTNPEPAEEKPRPRLPTPYKTHWGGMGGNRAMDAPKSQSIPSQCEEREETPKQSVCIPLRAYLIPDTPPFHRSQALWREKHELWSHTDLGLFGS